MSNVERVVVMTRRELRVIAGLTDQNEAVQVSIREQQIDAQDAFTAMRDGRVRSYVVTMYGPASEEYTGPSPIPTQFLLVSGPGIEDSIDVILLTNRVKSEEAA